jgi:hypothetical protein
MPWHFKGNTSNNYKKLYNFGELQKLGFLLLAKNPPHEFVLGIVGKFWGLTPKTVNLTPADFKGYQKKGMAKVGVNFSISQVSKNLYRIATETRIFCLDQTAKNKFRAYWTIVRPFSGLIRREWLRLIRTCAEVEK